MQQPVERVLIGYGSESGNAQGLAERLALAPCLIPYAVSVQPLAELDLRLLGEHDRLLILSSSFGDGEPPGNAEAFLEQLVQLDSAAQIVYAIFGLGDTAYPSFCGFTKALDELLQAKGAQPCITRVDADILFEEFFATWCRTLERVLLGDAEAGRQLHLQVRAYGIDDAYAARVVERRRLNRDAPHVHWIRLDIAGSGIKYRAGDNLYVVPQNDPALLDALAGWLGAADAFDGLADRELRQIGKPFLRELARRSGSETLKGLLKASNRKQLDAYLYGRDLLDILIDHATPGTFKPEELAAQLPAILPRAYSIACDYHPSQVDLCVREVTYERDGRLHRGCATAMLAGDCSELKVYARSNPRFHLPDVVAVPLILIGTGTGIAPLIGLLEQLSASASRPPVCLVFGERHGDSDFLYREQIQAWQREGVLSLLLTAFSRDQASRYYVQQAMLDQAQQLWPLLAQGAHVYLCGSKANLERSIDEALAGVAEAAGGLDAEQAQAFVQALNQEGRLHKELY